MDDEQTLGDWLNKMLSFMQHAEDYEIRKVAYDNFPWGGVSTVRIYDGSKPYETAIAHTDYKKHGIVCVEAYETKEEAEEGHKKWVATMTTEPLPDYLIDCQNALMSQLLPEEDLLYPRAPKEE